MTTSTTTDPDSMADPAAAAPMTRWALAGLALSTTLSTLGISIANVGLPTLAQAFGASFGAVQWVVLAYLLAITTLIVGVGRLGDVVGRRRLLLVGIAVFSVASAACALAPTLPWLIAARGVQGLGAAIMMVLSLALVGEIVPKARTGSAMGLLGTMSAIGTAAGPSVGGMLIAGFGWRALFAALVPLGVATVVIARRTLPIDTPMAAKAQLRFDIPGTLLLALTLAAYALAMTVGRGRFDAANLALLAAAAVGVGLFAVVEARSVAPLVRPAMFRDPTLAPGLILSALVSTVMMTTLVVGPFHLARALGLAAPAVGLVMSIGPTVVALAGVPVGRLTDRIGPARTTLFGLAAMVVGCGALAIAPLSLGVAGYVGPLVVVTLGYAAFQTANNTAVMAEVPSDRRGAVSGLLNLSRNLGLITGASVMGAVFAVATAAPDITTAAPEAVAGGTHVAFAVAVGLIGMALVIAVVAQRRARSAPASAVLR